MIRRIRTLFAALRFAEARWRTSELNRELSHAEVHHSGAPCARCARLRAATLAEIKAEDEFFALRRER